MKEPTDEELIEQSRNGDTGSLKILVTRKESIVAKVVMSMLGETSLAEDIGQEIFTRLYDSLHKVRGDISVDTYLVRLASEYALSESKRIKRTTNPAKAVRDFKEQVQLQFALLEPQHQLVLTLRMIVGYSIEETAEILKMPISTVLGHLAIAQHTLRKCLFKNLS